MISSPYIYIGQVDKMAQESIQEVETCSMNSVMFYMEMAIYMSEMYFKEIGYWQLWLKPFAGLHYREMFALI